MSNPIERPRMKLAGTTYVKIDFRTWLRFDTENDTEEIHDQASTVLLDIEWERMSKERQQ